MTKVTARRISWHPLLALLLAWAIMFVYDPATVPSLWFDEGWSLSVARNWVELGQYSRLLCDQPISSAGMAQPFAATAPVALAFRLFGVGAWQGRLAGAFFTMGALALLYALARRLYGLRVATATLFVAILLPMHNELNPLFMGRQALAEMPLFVYILIGYLSLLRAVGRGRWLVFTIVFGGIALTTKGHAIPFWSIALLLPLTLAVFRKKWRMARLLVLSGVGAPLFALVFASVQQSLEGGQVLYGAPMVGLYNVTIAVPQLDVRLATWRIVGLFGIPTVFGLGCAVWDLRQRRFALDNGADLVCISFVTLVGSWFIWYVLLSVNWERYFFPVAFFSSVFVALLLDRLTTHYDLCWAVKSLSGIFKQKRFTWQGVGVGLALILVVVALVFSSIVYGELYLQNVHTPAVEVAAFLNARAAPGALIETYNSELLFLLNRPYHYPPDQVQVELNQRMFLHQDAPIDYNPLTAADPDYLVVGPVITQWNLYRPAIASGAFRQIYALDRYVVYERVR